MVQNVVRNSPTHVASLQIRLVQRHFRRNSAPQNPSFGVFDIHAGLSLGAPAHFSPEMSLTALGKRE
jgi:hypothetical protein